MGITRGTFTAEVAAGGAVVGPGSSIGLTLLQADTNRIETSSKEKYFALAGMNCIFINEVWFAVANLSSASIAPKI
ncbi:hypothetical protein [Algoriphagus chordae]|uniref:hypothetical protein n=1 Tax=Algoriphagus chordae TaxID=237019 RepID=UPI001FEC628A|nr:hypothetical protein [Algoriphagus chordae]